MPTTLGKLVVRLQRSHFLAFIAREDIDFAREDSHFRSTDLLTERSPVCSVVCLFVWRLRWR